MRKLLDWIAAKLGYFPREFSRTRHGADAVERGQRWEAFYREEGGLADMIGRLRRDYFEKVADLKPGDLEALRALAMADRIAREIENKVQAVIDTGKIAENDAQHTANVASIRR
jgi:hypothetical protein